MEGVTTLRQSWLELSPTRCHQIIDSQLKGIQVDLSLYELLCDFLISLVWFHRDLPKTHSNVADAVKGIVAAQIKIDHILKHGTGKYYAVDICNDLLYRASYRARDLANMIEGQSCGISITFTHQNEDEFVSAGRRSEDIGFVIKNTGTDEVVFRLERITKKTEANLARFSLAPLPDPKANGKPRIDIAWETAANKCHLVNTIEFTD